MTIQKIMVQIADRAWTLRAVHQACLLARQTEAEVALMSMIPVQHLGWLGTDFGAMNFTDEKRASLHDYAATAEDYAVPCSLHAFQYFTLAEAVADAADHIDAQIAFATLPQSSIPFWRAFQTNRLRNRLSQQGRQLIELQTLEALPSAIAEPGAVSTLKVLTRQD